MNQKTLAQKVALFTTYIYLFLSVFVMFSVAQHILRHDSVSHHAAQHATLICSWMCAASTHVFSAHQNILEVSTPSFERLVFYANEIFTDSSVLSYYIRPPPFLFS